jgi:hypothetical protein
MSARKVGKAKRAHAAEHSVGFVALRQSYKFSVTAFLPAINP